MAAATLGRALRRVLFALGAVGAAAHAAGDAAAGEKVFKLCASCHEVGPSARSGFGPSLHGIVGRRAGAAVDFKYSDAMKRSGVVWTDATLAAFVKDPGAVVPGTRMRFYGLGDDKKIADLLAYLRGA